MAVLPSGDVRPLVAPSNDEFASPGYGYAVDENEVFPGLYNPAGGAPNDSTQSTQIWRRYEWPGALDIGYAAPGNLSLTAGSNLRVEDTTIGRELGVVGVATVAGFGSVLNLARTIIPQDLLLLWNGLDNSGSPTTDHDNPNLSAITFPPEFDTDTSGEATTRIRRNQSGRLTVGANGIGYLTCSTGGRVEAGRGLLAGTGDTARASILINGAGSMLLANSQDPDLDLTVGEGNAVFGDNATMLLANGGLYACDNHTILSGEIKMVADADDQSRSAAVSRTWLIESGAVVRCGRGEHTLTSVAASEGDLFNGTNDRAPEISGVFPDVGDFALGNLGTIVIEQGGSLTISQAFATNARPKNLRMAAVGPTPSRFGVIEMLGGKLRLPDELDNFGLIHVRAGDNAIVGGLRNRADSERTGGGMIVVEEGASLTLFGRLVNEGIVAVHPCGRMTEVTPPDKQGGVYLPDTDLRGVAARWIEGLELVRAG